MVQAPLEEAPSLALSPLQRSSDRPADNYFHIGLLAKFRREGTKDTKLFKVKNFVSSWQRFV
jgi:hypothetical protein